MEGTFFEQGGGHFGLELGPADPDSEAGAGPLLGEDILSIRRQAAERAEGDRKKRAGRLLSERLGDCGPAGAEAPTFAANLAERRQEQVDLNAGAALSRLRLEDPRLTAHMNARRELAAAGQGDRPPTLDALRAENKEACRGLSTVTLSLKEANMALRCAVEEVLLEADNAEKLACGISPHGYPPEGGGPPRLRHMGRRLAAAGASLSRLLQALEQTEADLTVARRLHDTSTAGLLLWVERREEG